MERCQSCNAKQCDGFTRCNNCSAWAFRPMRAVIDMQATVNSGKQVVSVDKEDDGVQDGK